jgi:hypothetical protein
MGDGNVPNPFVGEEIFPPGNVCPKARLLKAKAHDRGGDHGRSYVQGDLI